ncbi:MAG: hypothetical protein NVSMB1_00180 [Polyangiales bacterium]
MVTPPTHARVGSLKPVHRLTQFGAGAPHTALMCAQTSEQLPPPAADPCGALFDEEHETVRAQKSPNVATMVRHGTERRFFEIIVGFSMTELRERATVHSRESCA